MRREYKNDYLKNCFHSKYKINFFYLYKVNYINLFITITKYVVIITC